MVKLNVSKFRNAIPKYPQQKDTITEINIATPSASLYGDLVSSSLSWIAYASSTSSVGVISSSTRGRMSYKRIHTANLDGGEVSHLEFSPFDDNELLVSSTSGNIDIFRHSGEFNSTFRMQLGSKVEQIRYNPVAEGVVASLSSNGSFSLIDCQQKKVVNDILVTDKPNEATFFAWQHEGSLAAAVTKKGVVKVIDPRSNKFLQETDSGLTNCKPIWTCDENYIMLFGSQTSSSRKCNLYDVRNLSTTTQSTDIATGNSLLFPTYDADTGLVLCGSKGETIIICGEFFEGKFNLLRTDRSSYLSTSCSISPRLAVDVMSCEVARLYQLSKSEIVPIPYHVTRKTYSEFHDDLFPDTKARKASLNVERWLSGEEPKFEMVSMKPNIQETPNYYETAEMKEERLMALNKQTPDIKVQESDGKGGSSYVQAAENYSKFRYMKGEAFHQDKDFRNFNTISMTSSVESNGFAVSTHNVAVPIEGVVGKIGILNLQNPGRVPDCGPFFIENVSSVSDFIFDPYDQKNLAVACDNGQINIWEIPNEGLKENLKTPTFKLKDHGCKTTVIKYHPSSKGVLCSGDISGAVRVWDVAASSAALRLQIGENSSVYAMDWSADGDSIALCSANRQLYIVDPREDKTKNSFCYTEGSGPSRVLWIGEKLIFASTFTSEGIQLMRQFDLRSPSKALYDFKRHSCPAVLIPYFDEDNNLVYVYNKGGLLVCPFEIRNDSTGFFECCSYYPGESHQAVAFFPKTVCDVKSVEVARFMRLLKTSTETVSFKVIRVHTNYFQDDIYPDSRLVAPYSMNANEWLQGGRKERARISLQPSNMERLSTVSAQLLQKEKKYDSKLELAKASYTTDQETYDLIASVSEKMQEYDDKPCEQDQMQGVSDSEWED